RFDLVRRLPGGGELGWGKRTLGALGAGRQLVADRGGRAVQAGFGHCRYLVPVARRLRVRLPPLLRADLGGGVLSAGTPAERRDTARGADADGGGACSVTRQGASATQAAGK